MKFFVKNGLFPREVVFIEESTLKKVICALEKVIFSGNVKILRLAKEGELGLPKFFVINVEESVNYITISWKKGESIILYDEIDIKDSFELYVNEDFLVVEHIPGVWDSDNIITPDIILSNDNESIFSYLGVVINHIKKQINKTRFNCHFVRDADNEIFFLNIRNIKGFNLSFKDPNNFVALTKVEQIKNLPLDKPILFDICINRGNEISLLKYFDYFNNRVCYVKFGILSHPAIILREMGALTLPYIQSGKYSKINIDKLDA